MAIMIRPIILYKVIHRIPVEVSWEATRTGFVLWYDSRSK